MEKLGFLQHTFSFSVNDGRSRTFEEPITKVFPSTLHERIFHDRVSNNFQCF